MYKYNGQWERILKKKNGCIFNKNKTIWKLHIFIMIMKRKFKKWWWTISQISTKQLPLSPQNIQHFTQLCIKSHLSCELTTSLVVAITASNDAESHNKLDQHTTFVMVIIPSPMKLRRDIVTLLSFRPSFHNILVNTLESTSFNEFWPNLVHT